MKEMSTPILTKVQFMTASYEKKPIVRVKARPFSSLTYRKSGKIAIFIGGEKIVSEKESLTYIPAGCDYSTEILESGDMSVMHFETAEPPSGILSAPISKKAPFPLTFENTFSNALRHFTANGMDLFTMSAAYELLCEAHAVFSPARPSPPKRMILCKEYIDENICDSSLRISELAEKCGISTVYFRSEFKRYYGSSPIEYIKKRRMDVACRLLSTGLYSVSEVAGGAGFDSISYFSFEFHRLMGCSPSEYAKR